MDSESTHNFISNRVTEHLQLPVTLTPPFLVKVANGNPMKCIGRFEDVLICIQCIPFTLTFYSLLLIGLDVVDGVQWLESLGMVA